MAAGAGTIGGSPTPRAPTGVSGAGLSSTIVSIGGAAAIAAGVVVYLIAPTAAPRAEHAMYVAPAVDRDGAGLVLGGKF